MRTYRKFSDVLAEAGKLPAETPLEYLRRITVQRPVRYPPIATATDDKDGLPLPMTGKTAVNRRREVLAAERRSVMCAQDAALHRALEWTR